MRALETRRRGVACLVSAQPKRRVFSCKAGGHQGLQVGKWHKHARAVSSNVDFLPLLPDACWALSYLSDGDNDRIDKVIEANICRRLVELLM